MSIQEKYGKNRLRIFISYSKADIGVVKPLYHILSHIGFQPWLDEESLLPGQDWKFEISENIKKAHVILVCLSSNSVNKAGYLHKEIKEAINIAEQQPDGTIFIVPIKLEECDIPERLKLWHWLEIYKGKSIRKLIDSLNAKASSLGLGTAAPERIAEHSIYSDSTKVDDSDREQNDYPRDKLPKQDIVGEYLATGKNDDGSRYQCNVTISKQGDWFSITWYIGDSVRSSMGLLKGDILTVFGDYLVTYTINKDGSMEGIWGDAGRERLIPKNSA